MDQAEIIHEERFSHEDRPDAALFRGKSSDADPSLIVKSHSSEVRVYHLKR